MKLLKIFVIVIILVFICCLTYVYIYNHSAIQQARAAAKWIEDFYTAQGRYPNQAEFADQFPNVQGYAASNDSAGNPSQDFTFDYHIIPFDNGDFSPIGRNFAYQGLGSLHGPSGEYIVEPCPRWNQVGLRAPTPFPYIYLPQATGSFTNIDGVLSPDFNKGTISFVYSDRVDYDLKGKSILLLTGLAKPRLFVASSSNHKYATNGNNIYDYEIRPIADRSITLTNPKQIATVPTGCPAGYLK